MKTEIKLLLQTISSNADIRLKEIAEQNWNEEWEKTIQPIEIGERLVIKPSWAAYENKAGRIIIHIDPKMSFGTGYHETTRLTLQLLERYITPRCTLFDAGTGTGVLAIAGIKLGASAAVGVDIDEWSIINAQENVLANEVSENIEISDTPVERFTVKQFDIITANLTLNTNSELLPQFVRLLAPKGTLLLSGLLVTDRTAMRAKLQEDHFDVIEELTEHEWIAIAAKARL